MIRKTAVTLAAACLLGGCGVSTQHEPTVVEAPPGPFAALASAAPAAPSAAPSGPVRQQLYFVKNGKLAPVIRQSTAQASVETLLTLLRTGPTQAEQDDGYSTTFTGTQLVLGVHADGTTASVELAAPAEGSARSDEAMVYAQIVATLCARPDITAVTFIRDGQPVGVPRGDGSLSTGPLTAADYADLISGR